MDINFDNFNPRNLIIDVKSKMPKLSGEFFGKNSFLLWEIFFLILFLVGIVNFIFINPPKNFPIGVIVTVEKGETLNSISVNLKEKGVIKSELAFNIFTRLIASDKSIMSGDYFFEKPNNVFSVSYRMTHGLYGLAPLSITIYEGSTAEEIANIIAKKFSKFDPKEFIKLVKKEHKEGYLFPDTYLFLPNIKAPDVLKAMESNFYTKITGIQEEISKSELKLKDIIIMASILEKEAKTLKTRRIISGILWNRIKIGMPLQVDAVFPYILGKNTYQVTLKDLKVDSPYNTYKYKGLPAGPISNPGLSSILATVTPTKTNYLYYLSDRKGNMHYSVNFEGHKRNRVLYLGK